MLVCELNLKENPSLALSPMTPSISVDCRPNDSFKSKFLRILRMYVHPTSFSEDPNLVYPMTREFSFSRFSTLSAEEG